MSKEIWLGPLLGDNRSRLIERCSQFVAAGKANEFLYLAASHPLLELVNEQILDGSKNAGLWGELPVYLFRGFVRRILSTAIDEGGIRAALCPSSLSPRKLSLYHRRGAHPLSLTHDGRPATALLALARICGL